MIFRSVKSAGIAHKSYFIGSDGEAAIIDPRRDCQIYVDLASDHDLKITHIFETHRNEDYVLGSLELSELVEAEIYHGSKLNFAYGNEVKDGDNFNIGKLEFGILETPGHTDESISITLKDKEVSDDYYMVFTGDVLFAGEVGRIDLYGEEEKKRMSKNLYESISSKILPLGDGVIVCPAHGAGSVCGADIREQEFTTIGYEKRTNPLLQLNKDDFIQHKINEKFYTPPYFEMMELHNRDGPPILCRLPIPEPLSIMEIKEEMKNGAQILDLRGPTSFAGGHIPNSLNIWDEGLSDYAGWFLNYEKAIILIDEDDSKLDKVTRYLIRLGYDNISGYIAGGFPTWFKAAEETNMLETWTVQRLREHQEDDSIFILDVRKINEWNSGYIKGAHHIYLGYLKDSLSEVPKDKKIVVYCGTGFRASVGASILKMNGYDDVINVLGSMMAWKKAGYPVVKD